LLLAALIVKKEKPLQSKKYGTMLDCQKEKNKNSENCSGATKNYFK